VNPGPTTERVYAALKERVMSLEFRPGDRLDPAQLADTLISSVTPVREALHMLTGEALVDARTGAGFSVAQLDAPALQDLYGWMLDLALLALRAGGQLPTAPGLGAPPPYPRRIGAIFEAIGTSSTNIEHRRAILVANDRLHAARMAEAMVIDGADEEAAQLAHLLAERGSGQLRRALRDFTRRRQRNAARIVRILCGRRADR